MLTLDTKMSLYAEDQGLQVPMSLEHDTPLKSWPESWGEDLQLCDERLKAKTGLHGIYNFT